jgi:hypothetical protein
MPGTLRRVLLPLFHPTLRLRTAEPISLFPLLSAWHQAKTVLRCCSQSTSGFVAMLCWLSCISLTPAARPLLCPRYRSEALPFYRDQQD